MAALPPHSERQALFNLIEMHLWTVAVHHPSCFGISESGHEMDLNFFFCVLSAMHLLYGLHARLPSMFAYQMQKNAATKRRVIRQYMIDSKS
jgi:hypothetical protein